MRLLTTILFTLGTFSFLNAQGFSFSPNDMLEDEAEFSQYNIFQIDILNDTPEMLLLSWRRLEADYPEGWEVSFCDNNLCYGSIPINGDMIPFSQDNYAFLKLDINPYEVAGTGTFRFMVFPKDDPDNFKISTFIIHAGTSTDIVEVEKSVLKVGPNPAQDWLNVENLAQKPAKVNILSANGQLILMRKLPAHAKVQLDLSDLPAGSYYINVLSENGTVQQLPIIKH